jgi:preprotein translocase subunit Sss1
MFASFMILLVIGLALIFIGWRIWKKEQITLIHDYHYTRVAEKDKKSYTEKMGKACIIMGIGMILMGIINFISKTAYGWIFYGIFIVWGLIMIFMAQKKYNGGL